MWPCPRGLPGGGDPAFRGPGSGPMSLADAYKGIRAGATVAQKRSDGSRSRPAWLPRVVADRSPASTIN
eukprot:3599235-Alexandrium_andersonii.AAC.1